MGELSKNIKVISYIPSLDKKPVWVKFLREEDEGVIGIPENDLGRLLKI